MIAILFFLALAATGIAASVITTLRDGYRRIPTRQR
jgi:hypothetical protein